MASNCVRVQLGMDHGESVWTCVGVGVGVHIGIFRIRPGINLCTCMCLCSGCLLWGAAQWVYVSKRCLCLKATP